MSSSTSVSTRLEIWDYLSLSCLVALSTLVGIYHVFKVRKTKVTTDFLVTSKELGLFPLILSTVATFWSAIGMLGFPIETYMNGLSFPLIIFPILITIPIGSCLFLPVFFKLDRNTIFEYLELRFNKTIRVCTSLLLTFQTVLYTSCVMYAPALALNQVTGLNLWASVVSIGVVCIIYTSMGGIKAVVWADVTQCLMMMSVYVLIITKGTMDIGGPSVLWDRLVAGQRTKVFVFSSSPYTQYTFWTTIVANSFQVVGLVTLNQGFMQRYLSNKTLKRAQLTYCGGAFGISIGQALIACGGALTYAYFHDCDPLLSGQITVRDQMMALFAVRILSFAKGLSGVFVAGVMCATLSTLSSTLNSLSAVTLSDYIRPFKPNLSDADSIKMSRILVVFYGVVCVALVAWIENMGGVVKACFGINGVTGGPILAIFTIGMLLPFVNTKGATISFICSVALPMWAWLGSMITAPILPHAPLSTEGCHNFTLLSNYTVNPIQRSFLESFYSMHSFWYNIWSLLTGLIVALLVSKCISCQSIHNVDPDLLFPFMRNYVLKKKSQLTKQINEKKMSEENGHVIQPLLYDQKQTAIN